MRRFSREGSFELVTSMFTSFGYFDERDDDRRVLLNVLRSLKPGGTFLIDVMSREVLKRAFHPRNWREEDGLFLLEDGKVSENWDRVDTRWIILEGGERQEIEFSLYVYSADELTDLMRDCGLEVTGRYGWFDGSPYDENAVRLIVTAKKPYT